MSNIKELQHMFKKHCIYYLLNTNLTDIFEDIFQWKTYICLNFNEDLTQSRHQVACKLHICPVLSSQK